MGSQWRADSLDDEAWRPPPGLTRAARTAEQDLAAGGHDRRLVAGPAGRAIASIYFRRRTGRRVYAYLRWAKNGATTEQFICEIDRHTRSDNLAIAWSAAIEQGMLSARPEFSGSRSAQPVPSSWASSETVRKQMQANHSRDTRPELALRSFLHQMGLRYRVAARPLPGTRRTADVVFTKAQVAVFLDGCFWHGCPDHHRPARRNQQFWSEKISRNRERDAETDKLLCAAGWAVVRVWEHENPHTAAQRVREVVLSRGQTGVPTPLCLRSQGITGRMPGSRHKSADESPGRRGARSESIGAAFPPTRFLIGLACDQLQMLPDIQSKNTPSRHSDTHAVLDT